jgi:hypothetical protein
LEEEFLSDADQLSCQTGAVRQEVAAAAPIVSSVLFNTQL